MLQRNFRQILIEPLLRKRSVELIKSIYHLIHQLMESSIIFFCSPNGLRLMCDAVDVNKIVAVSIIKPPSYMYLYIYAQVTTGLKLHLG